MGISNAIKCLQAKFSSMTFRNQPPNDKPLEKAPDVFVDIPQPPPSLKAGLALRVWNDFNSNTPPPPFSIEDLVKRPEKVVRRTDSVLEAALAIETIVAQAPNTSNTKPSTSKSKRPPLPRTASATSTKSTTSASSSPYHFWDCGFGVPIESAPPVLFSSKSSFLAAVKGELHNVDFIQTGLSSYLRCINTGEHHTFSEEFLRKQNTATHITLGQLCQIKAHLEDVVREVEEMGLEQEGEVAEHLIEAFGHAKPWITTTRAILVSSHVFYKINYVLANEQANEHEGVIL